MVVVVVAVGCDNGSTVFVSIGCCNFGRSCISSIVLVVKVVVVILVVVKDLFYIPYTYRSGCVSKVNDITNIIEITLSDSTRI